MKLVLMGDVMLGGQVGERLESGHPGVPWGDTLDVLRRANIRVCNLECVLTDRGVPAAAPAKVFRFRSAARNVAALAEGGLDVVSLANNHALDYGHDGLGDMLSLLQGAGIDWVGAGRDYREAFRPAIAHVSGIPVGFVAFTDNTPAWEAGLDQPGVLYAPLDLGDRRMRSVIDLVATTRQRVETLVVSVHWGANWGDTPPAHHRTVGRALLEAGADIVFGHSPHVVRGIESYRGGVILFGAGGMVDDYLAHPTERNDESFIIVVDVAGDRLEEIRLHPITIETCAARRARGTTAQQIAARMAARCSALGTETTWVPDDDSLSVVVPAAGMRSGGPRRERA